MEVCEAIALAREKSESMSRLARVLTRLKPVIYATGTTIRLRDDELNFYCATVEDAEKMAASLPAKLELVYVGASTTLYGSVEIQGVTYNFEVPTIRKIHLCACELKRKRRGATGWFTAILLFNDLEVAKLDYHERTTSKILKKRLWEAAIRTKREKHRLEKFDFVL